MQKCGPFSWSPDIDHAKGWLILSGYNHLNCSMWWGEGVEIIPAMNKKLMSLYYTIHSLEMGRESYGGPDNRIRMSLWVFFILVAMQQHLAHDHKLLLLYYYIAK